MDGRPTPIGYDVQNKKLLVNEPEAKQIRRIFDLYLKVGSVRQLREMLDDEGIVTKYRRQRNGRVCGGIPFMRRNLYQLPANPIYIGRIPHKGVTYPRLHDGIVDQKVWEATKEQRSSQAVNREAPVNGHSPSLLIGMIRDETGDRLSPSHASKDGLRYRYYISHRLMVAAKGKSGGWRLPAKELEGLVLRTLYSVLEDDLRLWNLLDIDSETPTAHQAIAVGARRMANDLITLPTTDQRGILKGFVHGMELHPDRLVIRIDRAKLAPMLAGYHVEVRGWRTNPIATLDMDHQMRRRGVEAKFVLGNETRPADHDKGLISLIAKAHGWLEKLGSGDAASISDLAVQDKIDRNEISRFLPLAFLAPDITEAILAGRQPADLTIAKLRRVAALPYAWKDQRALLGFTS